MEQEIGRTAMEDRLRQFISFTVDGEEFGIELLSVKEVIRIRQITHLPGAPPTVRGVINLRGDVIPLVDLREKFGLPPREYGRTTRVIVAEVEGNLVGMVVDSASQVVRISETEIDPPPPMPGRRDGEYIVGVGKQDEKLVILVDAQKIITAHEVNDLARAAEEAAAVTAQGGQS